MFLTVKLYSYVKLNCLKQNWFCIKTYLVLNKLQRLLCHKIQTINQPFKYEIFSKIEVSILFKHLNLMVNDIKICLKYLIRFLVLLIHRKDLKYFFCVSSQNILKKISFAFALICFPDVRLICAFWPTILMNLHTPNWLRLFAQNMELTCWR